MAARGSEATAVVGCCAGALGSLIPGFLRSAYRFRNISRDPQHSATAFGLPGRSIPESLLLYLWGSRGRSPLVNLFSRISRASSTRGLRPVEEQVTRETQGRLQDAQTADRSRTTGAALEAHYQFVLWLVPTLERFPRSQKFLLGDRIQATALDVLESLIEATYTRQRGSHLRTPTWVSNGCASCCAWRMTCATWTLAATNTPLAPSTRRGAESALGARRTMPTKHHDLFDAIASFSALRRRRTACRQG